MVDRPWRRRPGIGPRRQPTPPPGAARADPSIFAFALVIGLLQALDAVRLAALALAALTGEPLLVACGVFLGAPIGLAQPEKGAPPLSNEDK